MWIQKLFFCNYALSSLMKAQISRKPQRQRDFCQFFPHPTTWLVEIFSLSVTLWGFLSKLYPLSSNYDYFYRFNVDSDILPGNKIDSFICSVKGAHWYAGVENKPLINDKFLLFGFCWLVGYCIGGQKQLGFCLIKSFGWLHVSKKQKEKENYNRIDGKHLL